MNSEILSAIIGSVMPYLTEIIKSKLPETSGKWLGYILSYGLCAIVGGATSYFSGQFNQEEVLASIGTALIASQGVYNLYFKPKKIDEKIEKALR